MNKEEVRSTFLSMHGDLIRISDAIQQNLEENFLTTPHVDKISSRVKGEESFLNKALKVTDSGQPKYTEPFRQIQDIIGARIVVFYKQDLEEIQSTIKQLFQFVEEREVVQDDVAKFGYEGIHFICFIPNFINGFRQNPQMPYFFELQIKTLYQHAWAQSQHGLGYKPETILSREKQRKIAFIAAQSWGADQILSELVSSLNS